MRCSVLAGDVKAFSAIFSYSSQSLQQSKIMESQLQNLQTTKYNV